MSYPNPNPTQIPESESEPERSQSDAAGDFLWWKILPVAMIMFLLTLCSFSLLGMSDLEAPSLTVLAFSLFPMFIFLILSILARYLFR